MLRFKSFLLEYLTDPQRKSFVKHQMSDKARSDNATSEHLHKALNDKDSDVREGAAEHLHKALNDKNFGVRRTATEHPTQLLNKGN